jgi:hypothetical protein
MIRRCAGWSGAKRLWAVRLRRARWAGSSMRSACRPKGPTGQDWLSSQAPVRSAAERGTTFPCKLHLSGGSWNNLRRVIAEVEWDPGKLYPRVGFIVINLSHPAERPRGANLGSGDPPPVRVLFLYLWVPAKVNSGSSGRRGWARSRDNWRSGELCPGPSRLGVFAEWQQNQAIHRNLGKVRAGSV